MKKTVYSVLIMILMTVVLGAQTLLDKQVASVNLIKPERISQLQLNRQHSQIEALRVQTGQGGSPLTKQQVLDLMISEILVNQAIERENITVSRNEVDETVAQQKASVEQQNNVALTEAQFRTAIAQQMGLSWEDYVSRIEVQLKQQKLLLKLKSDIIAQGETPPSFTEIDSFYRKNRSQFTNPDIIRFSHIFISTDELSSQEKTQARNRADEVYRKLQNGSTFESLVAEFSDDTRSRYRGGDAGYLAINDTRPVQVFGQGFVDTLFGMEEGETSRVLTSNRGYHIVKLTEYRDARILSLNDTITPDSNVTVRDYISRGLSSQKRQQALETALEEMVNDLRRQAEVTIYSENIN